MHLQESGEMYLEAIHVLSGKRPVVRAIDVADYLGYSKPSVSRAIGLLKEGGYVVVSDNGGLQLTDEGKDVAGKIFERHTLLTSFLTKLGVSPETADEDACKMEHVISDESMAAIKQFMK